MTGDIWSVLGITPTADAVSIKKAYAARLKHTKPQDDAKAYQRLRQAYEVAMAQARAMPKRDARPPGRESEGSGLLVARPAPIADRTEVPGAVGTPAPAQHAEDESPQPGRQRYAEGDAQDTTGKAPNPERHRQRLAPDDSEAFDESPQPGRQRYAEGDAQDTTGKEPNPERHRQRLAPDDGEALGERLQPGWRYTDDDAQDATHLAHEPPGHAPPDSDDLLDASVDSIKGYRSKNEQRRQVLDEVDADEQLHTATSEPALTAQVWALRLNELMHSDSQARLRGPELMAQLSQLDVTERAHANRLALGVVLAHVQHGPLLGDLIDRLDQEFEWTRDASWQRWIGAGEASRVMAVLGDLRRRRAQERDAPAVHTHAHAQTQTQRWRPPAPADGAEPLPLPVGWGHVFTLLKQRSWQPSTGLSLRLLLVLTLAFPLLARPLRGDERVSRTLMLGALALHVLGWLGLATGAAMAWGVPWPDAPALALTGYSMASFQFGLFRWVTRSWQVQRGAGSRWARWMQKPGVMLAVLALPVALAAWVMRSPNGFAAVGMIVLPYIGVLLASGSASWCARPGFNWLSLLAGVAVLVLALNDDLLGSLGVAQVPVLVWLPFASGLLALALSPWENSPRGRNVVCLAVLGALVWVNVELALATLHPILGPEARGPAWRVWLGINAASWAAAGLVAVLWTSCARYSGVFWVNTIVMLGLWLVAKDRGNAALDAMPLLTISVLAMLTVAGLQRVADRVALKLVLRGLSG